MTPRTLVAGIGNVFFGDDGFGVEVVGRLAAEAPQDGVRVIDIGIRGRDLAYELLDGGYDTAILVDAAPRGGAPGTVYVIEPDLDADDAAQTVALDGHSMYPAAVLALVRRLGRAPRVLIVGCEPASIEERMGLSPPVAAAVDEALSVVRRLVDERGSAAPCA